MQGKNHNMKTDNKLFENLKKINISKGQQQIKIIFMTNLRPH
jgi:hypothetical protein